MRGMPALPSVPGVPPCRHKVSPCRIAGGATPRGGSRRAGGGRSAAAAVLGCGIPPSACRAALARAVAAVASSAPRSSSARSRPRSWSWSSRPGSRGEGRVELAPGRTRAPREHRRQTVATRRAVAPHRCLLRISMGLQMQPSADCGRVFCARRLVPSRRRTPCVLACTGLDGCLPVSAATAPSPCP